MAKIKVITMIVFHTKLYEIVDQLDEQIGKARLANLDTVANHLADANSHINRAILDIQYHLVEVPQNTEKEEDE